MKAESRWDPDLKIGARQIGERHPVFVISEAGVNHDGDIALAERLIQLSAEARADCVKFQTYDAEKVVTSQAPKAAYQIENTGAAESQLAMLKRLQLPHDAYPRLLAACRRYDIEFLSTPYNYEDADFLDELECNAFKLASIHIAEPDFIHHVANKGKPLIMSSGMGTLAEIDEALRAVQDAGNRQVVLLQCTTDYPSRDCEANLRCIPTLRAAFGTLTGYSDHTDGAHCAIAAVALGATVLEKHFTTDARRAGPDHRASLEPGGLAEYVDVVRKTSSALGDGIKRPTEREQLNSPNMRRSIVATQNISRGSRIDKGMLDFRRPGTGLAPSLTDTITGARSNRDISSGEMLDLSMLEFDQCES